MDQRDRKHTANMQSTMNWLWPKRPANKFNSGTQSKTKKQAQKNM